MGGGGSAGRGPGRGTEGGAGVDLAAGPLEDSDEEGACVPVVRQQPPGGGRAPGSPGRWGDVFPQ